MPFATGYEGEDESESSNVIDWNEEAVTKALRLRSSIVFAAGYLNMLADDSKGPHHPKI